MTRRTPENAYELRNPGQGAGRRQRGRGTDGRHVLQADPVGDRPRPSTRTRPPGGWRPVPAPAPGGLHGHRSPPVVTVTGQQQVIRRRRGP